MRPAIPPSFVLMLLFFTGAAAAMPQEHGSTPATPALRVELQHGSVTVNGKAGTHQIDWVLQAHHHAGKPSGPEMSIASSGGETEIASGGMGDLTITVPADMVRLAVSGEEGDLTASHIAGQVLLETNGGNVTGTDIGGKLQIRTGGGNIEVRRNGSATQAETGGGSILIDAAGADVLAMTGGGNITVTALKGSGRFETSGGNITVHQASGSVKLASAGGNIQIGNISGDVIAQTGGGQIRLASAGGEVTAKTGSGIIECRNLMRSLVAETGAGSITAEFSREIKKLLPSRLETQSGDVWVGFPESLAVTVKAIGQNAAGRVVKTDFSGIHSEGPDNGGELRAGGRLNGGGPTLFVETLSGNITFERIR